MGLPSSKFQEVLTLIRLASRDEGVTFEELAEGAGIPRKKAMEYLECLPAIAIPPEGPDDILDFEIEGDGRIRVYYPLRLNLPMDLGEQDVLALRLALLWGAEHSVIEAETAESILAKVETRRSGLVSSIEIDGVEVHYPQAVDGKANLPILRKALEESRILRINYFSKARGFTSERRVRPHRLVTSEGFWYLRGWQEEMEFSEAGWRSFRVDRIESAEATEETFDPNRLPDLDRAETLFWFEEERTVETSTRFAADSARYIREAFPTSEVLEEEDGGLTLIHEVVGFPYYRTFILGFGGDATAIAPGVFREGIRTTLEEILREVDRIASS